MRAILTITCAATAVLVAAAAIAVELYWTDAVKEGKLLHRSRDLIERAAVRHSKKRPMVAWIGDSTLMLGPKGIVPYSTRVARRLGEDRFVETALVAQAGIDPFVEYFVVGKFLENKPDLVVIVANLRILAMRGKMPGFLSLASFLPRAEMLRAVWLPWHHRQVTLPRLFLARALGLPGVENAFYFYEGLHLKFRDELYSDTLKVSFAERFEARRKMFRLYVSPIEKPVLRMLGAMVGLAFRNGRPVVVVVSPIPIAKLREKGLYSSAVPDRLETIRQVVESAGGRLVDLHDALPADEFRDLAGHFTDKGADHMAELLDPVVREELAPAWPSLGNSAKGGDDAAAESAIGQ